MVTRSIQPCMIWMALPVSMCTARELTSTTQHPPDPPPVPAEVPAPHWWAPGCLSADQDASIAERHPERRSHVDLPNAAPASASFTNLRPTGAHSVSITSTFGLQDRPDKVCAVLQRLAASLPGTAPTVTVDGPKTYRTSVRVASPTDAGAVIATMQRWAWYAARREGLHLERGGGRLR